MVPLALLVALLILGLVAFLSPWPAALLIRAVFEDGARQTQAEIKPYIPADVDARLGLSYGAPGTDQTFDLFRPSGVSGPLPTVVWIHGGAWISGSSANVNPYAQILASHGYAVASLNYTLAPEASYPTALIQLNAALGHLVDNARELGLDPDRIVLAGDSAGSNLASQVAVLTTSPAYADLIGLEPAIDADRLRGMLLNCGVYDVSGIPDAPGLTGWGFRVALWAYIGAKDWLNHPGGQEMSTLNYVTADFPTTWITGGNGDPLTKTQSIPLADKLDGLGVDVTRLFYPDDHEPSLPHEYQFHLDFEDAHSALHDALEFLERVFED